MFVEIPVNKRSIGKRTIVHGVGVNDADYMVNPRINGKAFTCPFYNTWKGMLRRCYSKARIDTDTTYKDCSVCDEWLTFSNFKSWMIKQDWKGKQLDKDIIDYGNRVYSPEKCLFVTREINMLITNDIPKSGTGVQGVHFDKDKYRSRIIIDGRKINLGRFNSISEAYNKYLTFKSDKILEIANKQKEPLKSALIRISNEYKNKVSR